MFNYLIGKLPKRVRFLKIKNIEYKIYLYYASVLYKIKY